MIVRRLGSRVESVTPVFDSVAMNEIGFQRASGFAMTAAEFGEQYEQVEERALVATAEGDVKLEAEQALLDTLLADLTGLEAELGPEMLLMIESQPGRDYPKLRDRTRVEVVGGIENRLHFTWTVDPPLRVGIYRRRGG
jgi:hypothetical protein